MTSVVGSVGFADFQKDVLDASTQVPVLVDFWAAWCGPCRTLGPILEKVATALEGRLRVLKVDTEAEPQLAARFQIRSIPAVMLFRDGRVVSQFVGVQPEQSILDWLAPFLPPKPSALRDEARAALRSGDLPRARTLLTDILSADPADQDCREDLIEVALAAGDASAARAEFKILPDQRQQGDRGRALAARLTFADELAAVADGKADLDQLYAEGLRAAMAGAMPRAADAFLTLAQRSRIYREDAGRLGLLRLFELLGTGDPLVQEYRRRLAGLLH